MRSLQDAGDKCYTFLKGPPSRYSTSLHVTFLPAHVGGTECQVCQKKQRESALAVWRRGFAEHGRVFKIK